MRVILDHLGGTHFQGQGFQIFRIGKHHIAILQLLCIYNAAEYGRTLYPLLRVPKCHILLKQPFQGFQKSFILLQGDCQQHKVLACRPERPGACQQLHPLCQLLKQPVTAADSGHLIDVGQLVDVHHNQMELPAAPNHFIHFPDQAGLVIKSCHTVRVGVRIVDGKEQGQNRQAQAKACH